jgi:hypothetical protein
MANSFHNLPSAFTPLTPTPTPPGTSSNTSSSLSSETSSIVSRQSSTRSTTSVVAVPIRKPVRGPAHAPLNRANSSGIGRGFDSSSVSVVTPAPTNLPAGTGGSYFAGVLPSGAPPMRRGSSGEGSAMRTPPGNVGDGRLGDWTAVGVAVTGVKTGEDETPTRPSAGRAPSSATTTVASRPRNERDGSASSLTMIRKTVGDFTVGETLGEGSYSTVRSRTFPTHPPRADDIASSPFAGLARHRQAPTASVVRPQDARQGSHQTREEDQVCAYRTGYAQDSRWTPRDREAVLDVPGSAKSLCVYFSLRLLLETPRSPCHSLRLRAGTREERRAAQMDQEGEIALPLPLLYLLH